MTLKQGKSNQTYRVEAIHTSLDLERRLEALGLTDGSLITVINNEKKGAMTARFRGAGAPDCRADHCFGGESS